MDFSLRERDRDRERERETETETETERQTERHTQRGRELIRLNFKQDLEMIPKIWG